MPPLSITQLKYLQWLEDTLATYGVMMASKWVSFQGQFQNTLVDLTAEKQLRQRELLRLIREHAYANLPLEEIYAFKISVSRRQATTPVPDHQLDPRYDSRERTTKRTTHIFVNMDLVRYEGGNQPKILVEPVSTAFGVLVLQAMRAQRSILEKGLSPIDWSVLDSHQQGQPLDLSVVRQVLRCYRNLIDAWKQKELPLKQPEFHRRGLAAFIGWRVDTIPNWNTVQTDKFRLNSLTYLRDQLKDPDSDNNFLLQLNMLYP